MKTPIHAKNPGTAPNPGVVILLALVSSAAILSIIPDTIVDTVPIPAPVPTIVEGGVFIKVG